jgi:hypothetical protein
MDAETETSDKDKGKTINKTDELYVKLGFFEQQWFSTYPPRKEAVMPTLLGNILKSAEVHPFYRYNVDVVLTWHHIQNVLPEFFLSNLQAAWYSMRRALNVNLLSLAFILFWIGYSIRFWEGFLFAAFALALGSSVFLISYFALLQYTREYSALIKVAYDLYRFQLIDALHLEHPRSYGEEKALWGDIVNLLYRNYPPDPSDFHYASPKK